MEANSSYNTAPHQESGGYERWTWLALAGAALVVFLLVLFRSHEPREGGALLNKPMPAFSVQPLLDVDQPIGLDDLRGKVTVLNFWGTWCPPCVMEFPQVVDLQKRYGERDDFRLIAVSCGGGDENREELQASTQNFLDRRHVKLPMYFDADHQARSASQIPGYPTTLLLDKAGVVRSYCVGPFDEAAMTKLIESLLKNPS